MQRPAVEPIADRGGKPLSEDEAAEFARGLAGIARTGLPLADGLRALARELPTTPIGRGMLRVGTRSQGLRAMLLSVADRVEAGDSLEAALDAEGPRFPAPLRGLIAAGGRSGRMAEALGRYLELEDFGHSLKRRLWVGLAYPLIMLAISFGLFLLASLVTTQGFESIFKDFGIDVPWITATLLAASRGFASIGLWVVLGPIVALVVTWVVMRLTLGPAERQAVIQGLPLVGPLSRDTALAQFCPILALMLESDLPLGAALRLSAEAARGPVMAEAARKMAADVESGKTLAEAARGRRPFPRGFDRLLAWAEERGGLAEALTLAAETAETRARMQSQFIARFCNVVTMTVVMWWVGLTVVALFLPLFNLLGVLAGPPSLAPDWMQLLQMIGVGVVATAGVLAVLTVCWPVVRRMMGAVASPRVEGSAASRRARFWHFAALGWTLFGLASVLLLSLWGLHWLGADWMEPWWRDEVWPMTQLLGVAVGGAGLVIVAFATTASRIARWREARGAFAALKGGAMPRVAVRLPAWRFGLRHMMFAMAPIAMLILMVRDLGWALGSILALLAPPFALVATFLALSDRKAVQRDALLQVMAMAARDGRPLAPAVAAFAEGCRGRYGVRASALATCLARGDSLPEALDRVPGALSPVGEAVARVGWECGNLARSLGDAVAAVASARAARAAAIGAVAYPLGVFAAIFGIGVFLLGFVAPTFMSICNDFQVPLPEPSRTLFAAAKGVFGWIARPNVTLGFVLGGVVGGVAFLCALASLTIGRTVLAWIPLGDRLARRRHVAVILRALSGAIEAGRTVPEVLDRLAKGHPRPWVRRRVRAACERVERGDHWCLALGAEGLLRRVESDLLASAERAGNLPWALREAADGGERRSAYRLAAAGQVVNALAIAAMGGLVLLFGLTYFRPLIAILDALTGSL